MTTLLQITTQRDGGLDIVLLRGLVAAHEQNDQFVTSSPSRSV
jgi:hypothetical protein